MKIKSTDLVYVLGSGSRWNDNEIRYSLRSVSKNLSGVGKVFIVGQMPDFIKGCIHVPCADIFNPSVNADGNMIHKLLTVCNRKDLSQNFLFMNDDFIIHKPMIACHIPWMHKGDMANQPDSYWTSQFYRFRLKRTFKILQTKGMSTLQYDYHAPMLMDKDKFIRVMQDFDYREDIGYTFRSLYGNYYQLPAIPFSTLKVTVFKFLTLEQINKKTASINFVGYNDEGLNNSLKWWLIDSFPRLSKYEVSEPQDQVYEIYQWVRNGKKYTDGIRIFKTYYRHKHLCAIFEERKTHILEAKLNFKLMQLINTL